MITRSLILAAALLAAAPAVGQERTWTIATGVFTTKAELIAVRGDVVYLKINGKVEEYAFNRLSAADQKYVASLSLAPIVQNVTNEQPVNATAVEQAVFTPAATPTATDIMPTPLVPPTPPTGETGEHSLLKDGPTLNPTITEEAIPLPTGPTISGPAGNTGMTTAAQGPTTGVTGAVRSSNYESATPPSSFSNQTPYRSTAQSANTYNNNSANNANARRLTQQQLTQQQLQAQQQQQRRTTAQQNQNQNQNQNDNGILSGLRRRNDRSR